MSEQKTTDTCVPADRAIVPGMMRCAKCSFVLVRTTLYMRSGTAGPGDNKTEPCPNGCGPLWPMTWQQQAEDLEQRCIEQMERARGAEAEVARINLEVERLRAALNAAIGEFDRGFPLSALNFLLNAKEGLP